MKLDELLNLTNLRNLRSLKNLRICRAEHAFSHGLTFGAPVL